MFTLQPLLHRELQNVVGLPVAHSRRRCKPLQTSPSLASLSHYARTLSLSRTPPWRLARLSPLLATAPWGGEHELPPFFRAPCQRGRERGGCRCGSASSVAAAARLHGTLTQQSPPPHLGEPPWPAELEADPGLTAATSSGSSKAAFVPKLGLPISALPRARAGDDPFFPRR